MVRQLVYFYNCDKGAPVGSSHNRKWDKTRTTNNEYAVNFKTEGFWYLFKRMLELGVVDEVLVFIDSWRSAGILEYSDRFKCIVVPSIEDAEEFIKPKAIVYFRGGFKLWIPFIERVVNKAENWILFYDANTGRKRWPYWDVVLDDLIDTQHVTNNKLYLPFRKPTHQEIFKLARKTRLYDLCIGASYVHDKKGQWQALDMVTAFQQIFGKELTCVVPGGRWSGTQTVRVQRVIRRGIIRAAIPGMLKREEMPKVYNTSKLFIHMGGGCNDRGMLEAMSCGVPCMIKYPTTHDPALMVDSSLVRIIENPNDPEAFAKEVYQMLMDDIEEKREKVLELYRKTSDVDTVIVPFMGKLFDFMYTHPKNKKEELFDAYR